jgi:hypothetical protein
MSHIVTIHAKPTCEISCIRHSREGANPRPNAGTVWKLLVIEPQGVHQRQRIEPFVAQPFVAQVGGQAVEEIVDGSAGLESEKRLCAGVVHGAIHRASSHLEEVRKVRCEVGNIREAHFRESGTQVSPGNSGFTVGGSKGAQTGRARLQSHCRDNTLGDKGRGEEFSWKVNEA